MKLSKTLLAIVVVLALSGLAAFLEMRGRYLASHPGLPRVVPEAAAEVSPAAPGAAPAAPARPRPGGYPRIG